MSLETTETMVDSNGNRLGEARVMRNDSEANVYRDSDNEADINFRERIAQGNPHANRLARAIHGEQDDSSDDYDNGDEEVPAQITISEEEILNKVAEFRKDIYTYDESISLYANKEKGKQLLNQMGNYLRPFGDLTPAILNLIKTIKIDKIKPPRNSKLIRSLLVSKISPEKISGKNYMSIYKAQKYLLNLHPDIGEITNFFHVVDKNNSSILLKSFRDNKQALINIVVGLIKIAFAYKKVLIKYDYTYDLIYKDQVFEDVVFDFDSFEAYGDYNFLKKLIINDEEKILKIRLAMNDFKRANLIIKNETGRNSDDLSVDEIPKEFEIEVFEAKEYENAENLQFSKEVLQKYIKNEEFQNKMFDFINGAILIYPEILEHLPENITLKEEDFKIFEYLSKKEEIQN